MNLDSQTRMKKNDAVNSWSRYFQKSLGSQRMPALNVAGNLAL
jgi:hypothetical protein